MLARTLLVPTAVLLVPLCSALAQGTTRVGVDSLGAEANGASWRSAITPDGRFVAFESDASNLVGSDTNGARDVFVRDRLLGTTELISVSITSASGDDYSFWPSISADGRYVAFSSYASDLVAGDVNGQPDAFLRDRQIGTTVMVSVTSAGQIAYGGWSGAASISGDGHLVAFISSATNLGGWMQPGLYLHDLLAGSTSFVVTSGQLDLQGSPALSFDGRYTAWATTYNLGAPGLVYVFDRTTVLSTLGSTAPGGLPNSSCYGPSLSDNGRYLAFVSAASNIVPNDTSGFSDVFVTDLQTATTERVSAAPGGVDADAGSGYGRISTDGRYVVFASSADNLVPNDTNGVSGPPAIGSDVFIRDRLLATTERVSLTDSGAQSDDASNSLEPSVSSDGLLIAFSSSATNLVSSDTNGVGDVFVRDRGSPPPVTYCTAKVNSLGCVPAIGSSGMPSMSGPDSFYVTATNVLNNKSGMMLWAGAQGSVPFHGGILCLAAPIVRTTLQNSGGSATGLDCTGGYSYFFSQSAMAAHFLAAGSQVCCQFWSRDPGFPIPSNRIGLTDGLQFVVGP